MPSVLARAILRRGGLLPLAAVAVALLAAACGGGDGGGAEEPVEAGPATIGFERLTPLDKAGLTRAQREQFEDRQEAVVAGISGTIAQSPANVGTGPDDVEADPTVVVSDGGEVILVRYTVPGVAIQSAFDNVRMDDQVVDALYPLVAEGALSSLDDPGAVVEQGIVFPPNFIPDEGDPLDSRIDYNDAIGGGESGTRRPEGEPVRFFEVANGPTFIWP